MWSLELKGSFWNQPEDETYAMIEGHGEMERTQVLDFTELLTHLNLRHPYEGFAVVKGSKCLTDYASVLEDIISFMVLVLSAKNNLAEACIFSSSSHYTIPYTWFSEYIKTPDVQLTVHLWFCLIFCFYTHKILLISNISSFVDQLRSFLLWPVFPTIHCCIIIAFFLLWPHRL